MLWLRGDVMPAVSSHAQALRLASISTGSVMKLNSVVNAKRTMPNSMTPGNKLMVKMPMSNIHCTQFEANETTGTRAERIWSGA